VARAAESGRTTEVLSKAVKIRRLNNMQVKRRDVDSKKNENERNIVLVSSIENKGDENLCLSNKFPRTLASVSRWRKCCRAPAGTDHAGATRGALSEGFKNHHSHSDGEIEAPDYTGDLLA
jgi:hypothetical protein